VLDLSLRVAEDGFRIIEEQLSSSRENLPLYKVIEPASPFTNQLQVSYNNFARGAQQAADRRRRSAGGLYSTNHAGAF